MKRFALLFLFLWGSSVYAFLAGVATTEITPPIGTPSAGYAAPERKMTGVHDSLSASALVIDSGGHRIAFCGVDHLGFDQSMVEEIREKVLGMWVFVGSSHTHSGAGAYLPIPVIGEYLAGPYQPAIRQMLVDRTAQAILKASETLQEARIGFGYGKAPNLAYFRNAWPENVILPEDLALIKIVDREGKPIAALFNYAVHPTVLSEKNTLFSSDFVGFARAYIQKETGACPIYFNGAQAEINPNPPSGETEFERCASLGTDLGRMVVELWRETETSHQCALNVSELRYSFEVKPTSAGLKIPLERYDSELNVVVFNQREAFVTMPGELSCLYVEELKQKAPYPHLSILGLTNDAHGYILKPEAFVLKTPESQLSFGGPEYGNELIRQLLLMLQ